MGIALWLLCGVAVFAASRVIAPGRPARFVTELLLVIIASALSGLAATALDFGGWGELDWRAGAFVILCDFAVIGLSRAIRMTLLRRSAQH
jgi:hypothetical protein